MAKYRLAESLATLREQIDDESPNRRKSSDGWIGDLAHQKSKSEHNPDKSGVVRAMDITHDPLHGVDNNLLVERLKDSQDDRIMYIIWNGRIMSGTGQSNKAWVWRKYNGKNPHNKHFHVSVKPGKIADDKRQWDLTGAFDLAFTGAPETQDEFPILVQGNIGPYVKKAQVLLIEKGFGKHLGRWGADGKFGGGTLDAVVAFQKKNGLSPDGKIGDYTWEKLNSKPANPN